MCVLCKCVVQFVQADARRVGAAPGVRLSLSVTIPPKQPPTVRWIAEPAQADRRPMDEILPVLAMAASGAVFPGGAAPSWRTVVENHQRAVFACDLPGRSIFCKLYRPRFTWRLSRIGEAFQSSTKRAVRAFERMRDLGVPTAEIVAAGELIALRRGLALAPSFLVTSSPTGRRTLREALTSGALSARGRARVVESLREMTATIHGAGYGSLELSPQNVLVEGDGDRVVLFDIDRLARFILPHQKRRIVRRDVKTVEQTCVALVGRPTPALRGAAGHAAALAEG